jgi:transposase InsO family protein
MDLAVAVARQEVAGRSLRAVAGALGIARSQLMVRLRGKPAERGSRRPTSDADLVADIRAVVDVRASYGYRRVTALVNRDRHAQGRPRVNHKRTYRVMRAAGLLLARYTGRPTRTHDGKVMTLKSDLRWCSDAFEIRCWSGERVQVAFALDCCDREVLGYIATSAAITGEMVRDLMAEAVEQRFGPGATSVPHAIEWLSDNGPPYTARDTREFGRSLGLLVCTTPAYSPESNGMAEAFVKGFKRDYVYVNRLDDAPSVMRQLAAWIADYNDVHPHKALRMQSPREYRRLYSTG